MKISYRLKQLLSITLVSVLAATVMPSAVSAEPQFGEDNVVTVEVDLGEGPGDEIGCEGFATLNVPDETLSASFNGRVLGKENPTTYDLLVYYWPDIETNFMETLTSNFTNPVIFPENATGQDIDYISYDVNRIDETTVYYNYLDSNEDGIIDEGDAPESLKVTRRTYATNWFNVTYDADDCVDSQEIGLVLAGRIPVMRQALADSEWTVAELDWIDSTSMVNRAESRLKLRTELIGGLISLPYTLAYSPIDDLQFGLGDGLWPVALGDEGSAQLRAVMDIFGSNPSGTYRSQFFFQLEVEESEYWDNLNYLGCYLGPCL